jgi:hypothetical protein
VLECVVVDDDVDDFDNVDDVNDVVDVDIVTIRLKIDGNGLRMNNTHQSVSKDNKASVHGVIKRCVCVVLC